LVAIIKGGSGDESGKQERRKNRSGKLPAIERHRCGVFQNYEKPQSRFLISYFPDSSFPKQKAMRRETHG
jgi:hypothetical protein